MKRLVVDIDGTMAHASNGDYRNAACDEELVQKLREYKEQGFEIVLATSRNVRTFNGNIGKINAQMLPTLIEWLQANDVPYDEIWTGKPWCGFDGFYIDDKAIRPDEFKQLTYDEISRITGAN